MIKIDFQEPTDQEWIDWRNKCSDAQNTFNADIEGGVEPRPKADSSIYGANAIKEKYYSSLDGAFHGKCVYCESDISSSQRIDIDHYRPKGAIKDSNGKKIKVTVNGVENDHPGYYWLAYDWRNLVPTCQLCNQANKRRADGGKAIGKLDYFPLQNEQARAKAPGEEAIEAPLLINPLWEDPGASLELDSTGVFTSKDVPNGRGQACIDTFGLNFKGLADVRAEIYDDVLKRMMVAATQVINDPHAPSTKQARARIERIEKGYERFSAAGRLAILDARTRLKNDIFNQ